jgi:hypothetical protein
MSKIDKRELKGYVRFDGTGRIVPSSLILRRKKPKVGKWVEIPAYECCNDTTTSTSTTTAILPLRMLFSNISEVDAIIGDSANVSDWNTYFDLPSFGTPFTSVSVTGDEVKLYGGSNIIFKQHLFDQADQLGTYLLEIDDQAGCVIELEYSVFGDGSNNGCYDLAYVNFPNVTIAADYALGYVGSYAVASTISLPNLITAGSTCFEGCTSLTTIDLPSLTTVGHGCFQYCTSLTTINIPSCTNLGGTVGDNNVFFNISGNTITLTVPSALMTADAGNPDGDIVYLQANNTVTIVTT